MPELLKIQLSLLCMNFLEPLTVKKYQGLQKLF